MPRPAIGIDFDDTIHANMRYAPEPVGPPVPGALAFVNKLLDEGWTVDIFSARADSPDGRAAIKTWLTNHDFPVREMGEITNRKKPTWLATLDDRGIRFDGDFRAVWDFLHSDGVETWTERAGMKDEKAA